MALGGTRLQEGEELVGIVEHGVRVERGAWPVRQVVRLEDLVALDEPVDVAAHGERLRSTRVDLGDSASGRRPVRILGALRTAFGAGGARRLEEEPLFPCSRGGGFLGS